MRSSITTRMIMPLELGLLWCAPNERTRPTRPFAFCARVNYVGTYFMCIMQMNRIRAPSRILYKNNKIGYFYSTCNMRIAYGILNFIYSLCTCGPINDDQVRGIVSDNRPYVFNNCITVVSYSIVRRINRRFHLSTIFSNFLVNQVLLTAIIIANNATNIRT